jgi:hypothetical protein
MYDGGVVDNLEQLIIDMKDSLEREIKASERKVDQGFAQINSRFDLQALRLDRHAALWQNRPPLEFQNGCLGRRGRHGFKD